jgi:hypothetical protein
MAYYLNSNGKWTPYRESALDVRTSLPPGNYAVQRDQFENIFLVPVDDFKLPERLYGDAIKNTNRIITTFHARPATTGVLLAGEKGSGKTLLTKSVCATLKQQNIPTIIVNQPFMGDAFNNFLQSIDQPCAILFDEFEKVYEGKMQAGLLTLLDGVFSSKKLFLLTCNDSYRIDSHMKNRPGRLFYMFKFTGLSQEFIEEYCQNCLNDKTQIAAICRVTNIFSQFNFDMLAALVEEMNRYNETPQEALSVLNILPENDDGGRYNVSIIHEGELYTGADAFLENDHTYVGSPIMVNDNDACRFTICKKVDPEVNNGHKEIYEDLQFSQCDFKRYDPADTSFHFERNGSKLILSKVKPEPAFNYRAF